MFWMRYPNTIQLLRTIRRAPISCCAPLALRLDSDVPFGPCVWMLLYRSIHAYFAGFSKCSTGAFASELAARVSLQAKHWRAKIE